MLSARCAALAGDGQSCGMSLVSRPVTSAPQIRLDLEFSAEVGAGASNVWVPLPLRGTGVLLLRGEPRYSSRDTGSHQEIRDSPRTHLQARICVCRLGHARTQPHTAKVHIQQRANTRRSKSKSYGQSVSSLTPEEWRVRLEGLGDSVSRRTLATRDGSKSEVDAPCLCVWETQSRT